MHLETMAEGNSFLHHMDPRAKIVVAVGFSVLISISPVPGVWIAGLVCAMACVVLGRLQLGEVGRRLLAVNVFVVFLWVFLPWKLEIDSQSGSFSLAWDLEGIKLATAITLKTNAIVLGLMALLSTSSVNNLFHALAHMRTPDKLVHLFLFFYRYLHVLHREYHRLVGAMKVRGFKPGTNWHTYRSYGNLVGMLLVKSIDRADRVYGAMRCRGFDGTLWLLDHFHWSRRENLFLVLATVVLAILTIWSLESAWS